MEFKRVLNTMQVRREVSPSRRDRAEVILQRRKEEERTAQLCTGVRNASANSRSPRSPENSKKGTPWFPRKGGQALQKEERLDWAETDIFRQVLQGEGPLSRPGGGYLLEHEIG